MRCFIIFNRLKIINISILLTLILLVFTSNVFAFGGASDTTWTRFKHIRNAAITYSASTPLVAGFVARKFDLDINPTGAFLSAIIAEGTNVKKLRYTGISSFSSDDYSLLATFCAERGYPYDSMFMWVNDDSTIELNSIAPAGAPCTGGSVVTNGGDSLRHCGWASYRTVPDFRRPELWEYHVYKYFNKMGNDYDGIMEDEATFYYHPIWDYYASMMCFPFKPNVWVQGSPSAVRGWEGMTHDEIRDSLQYLKQYVWLPQMMDTLNNMEKLRFPNPAGYGIVGSDVIDDCILTGSGVLLGEGMALTPTITNDNNTIWAVMDTIATSEKGYAIVWTSVTTIDSLALGSWSRCMMERLTWYYMAADYDHFYLMITGLQGWLKANDWGYATDSLYKWSDAFEYDIGQPDSARYIDSSGTDGAGQPFNLFRRDYTRPSDNRDVIMLYRPKSGANYSSASECSIPLGGTYQPLLADGTLGAVTNTAVLRNVEGMIYVDTDASLPPVDTIPPSDVQDLGLLGANPGDNHGEIKLSWHTTGDDGIVGVANNYDIRYSTNPINNETDWANAIPVHDSLIPQPSPYGNIDSCLITNLPEGQIFYTAIKVFDEVGNSSNLGIFPTSYSGGIRVPQTIITETNPNDSTAIMTCNSIDSYYPSITYEFVLDTISQLGGISIQGPSQIYSDTSVGYNNLIPNLQYYWYCRAVSTAPNDSSNWSFPLRGFTVNAGETIPVLAESDMISPSEGEVFENDNPVFSVAYVPNLINVYFQVDVNLSFNLPIESGAVVASSGEITSWQPESPLNIGTYYWRVSPDNSSWTTPVSFNITTENLALDSDPDKPHPYPNPFKLSQTSNINFTNIPSGSNLYLLTVSGELVKRLNSETGEDINWDGTNESGIHVASGVYLWYIENTDYKGKVMVIR